MGKAPGGHDDKGAATGDPAQTGARTDALPDLNPWREVGWIFRDGDCVAIARDGGDVTSPYARPG